MLRLLAVLLAWVAWGGLARAQDENHAHTRVFARQQGHELRVALEIEIEPGYHLFHDDKGHPDAAALPTVVTLTAPGFEFGKVVFPKPKREEQEGLGTWVWVHEGVITLYARASSASGASAGTVHAEIRGQTCNAFGCSFHEESVDSEGAGADAIWAGFDAAMASAAPAVSALSKGLEAAPAGAKAVGEVRALGGASEVAGEQAAARAPSETEDGHLRAALYARRVGAELQLALELDLDAGYHIYHTELGSPGAAGQVTRLDFAVSGASFDKAIFPEPHKEAQGPEDWAWIHEGKFVVYARGSASAAADPAAVAAKLTGQLCNANGCLPFELELAPIGAGQASVWSGYEAAQKRAAVPRAADVAAPSPGYTSDADAGSGPQPLGAFLLAAIFGGLFALLMPCTYPMIPITISFFTKQAEARGKNSLGLSLMYGLGIVLCFVAIGAAFGPVIIPFANHALTNLVFASVFVLFALSLFGAFELQPPRFLMNMAGNARQSGGVFGVFFMGATLAVTSFTCTAPFVGSLLAGGASSGGVLRVLLGMAVFGLTMAVPFVALSLLPGKLRQIPRAGEWMHTLKVFLGFLELAAGLKFISNVDIAWHLQLLPRELFLFLWCAIFASAAFYLLGLIRLAGESEGVSPWRMISGVATLLLAVYCGYGALGNDMDRTVTAFLPDYSSARQAAPGSSAQAEGHAIVVDDLEQAIAQAISSQKLVMVNFTGHLCSVCRAMENSVFPRPEVQQRLQHAVEARLHVDAHDEAQRARILVHQEELTHSKGTPHYVLIDPKTRKVLSRMPRGNPLDPQEFVDFLDKGLAAAR